MEKTIKSRKDESNMQNRDNNPDDLLRIPLDFKRDSV